MAIVEIDANLPGDSSQSAAPDVVYAGTLTAAGSSSQTADPAASYAGAVAAAGSSSQTSSLTASYAGAMTAAGSSSQAASPTASYAGSMTAAGSSSQTADASYSVSMTAAGSSSQTADPTASYAGAMTAAGSASQTSAPTVAYSATATAPATSSLSGPLGENVTSVMPGDSNLSPQLSELFNATAAGSSAVSATASLIAAGTSVMAGSSSQAADQNRIDSNPQGFASFSQDATATYSVSGSADATATVVASAGNKLAAAVSMDGSSAMSASSLPIAITSAMAGNSILGIANPISLVTASMQGIAAVVANTKVSRNAQATMAGSSSLSPSPNYVRIEITATLSGGSDLNADPLTLGEWGEDGYGNSPYGGTRPPYGLLSAEALSQTLVRVRYTDMFDVGFPGLLALFNYSISPLVTIHSISIESTQSVLLNTDPLTGPLYTVTIGSARGYFGQPLSPYLASQSFVGVPASPTLFAVATSKTRVRVVFSDVMLQNSALTDPAKYQLTDLNGTAISILSVVAEQSSNTRSTVLLLGENLVDERHYQVTTDPGIVTAALVALSPNTSVFQWVENALRTQVSVTDFSGEVQNGLYGIHGGLVFFSPALQNSAPNSIIQVEEVDVCTRAFDEYHPPQPIDPPVLVTFGLSSWTPAQWAGIDPIPYVPPITTLNSDAALWAAFPRMVDAKFELTMPAPVPGGPDTSTTEHVPPPVDSICDITLAETWDLTRVSLLNITSWRLFNNNLLNSDTPYTGATASISGFTVGVDPLMPLSPPVPIGTLTGLSGMSPVISLGGFLTLSGAGYSGNNGTFKIVAFLDPTSVQIVNPFGVGAPDANNGAITWVKPPGFITAAVLKSGGLSNILPAAPGFLTLTGLVGMAASDVGNTVTIYGANTPANNGSFLITAFISGSSVVISNPSGVAPDLNNGLIGWATAPAPIPPGNTTSRTYLEIFMDGEADVASSANVLLASQATMAGSASVAATGTVL